MSDKNLSIESKDQIRQLIENHEQEWQEVASIKFWQHVAAARQAIGYCSVKEIFARFKIVPRFKKFDDLFQEALSAKLLKKINTRTAVEFASSITTKLQKVDETCVEVDPDDSPKQIADKITNKRREILAAEFAKINANSVEYLFPRCADWKIQDIFMALKDTERKNWSKRMYDNVLYSAIFQRYFKDDYDNLSDQIINEFLPARIENEVRSDFILVSDHSPFLICEYGEEEYVSNHEKLIKLLETMQKVLKNRREGSVYCTSDIYGALCCKEKLALFYMDYNSEAENYPCYFLAANETDLQTTTLQLENIGTIIEMNIMLMIAGFVQTVKKPRREQASIQTTFTPSKIDGSQVLHSHRIVHENPQVDDSEIDQLEVSVDYDKKSSNKSGSKSSSSSKNELSTSSEEQNFDRLNDDSINNESQNTNDKSKEEEKHVKELLAKFTKVNNSLIGTHGRFYKITDRITDTVHFVNHKNCTYIAKLKFLDKIDKEEEILKQLSDDNFIKPIRSKWLMACVV